MVRPAVVIQRSMTPWLQAAGVMHAMLAFGGQHYACMQLWALWMCLPASTTRVWYQVQVVMWLVYAIMRAAIAINQKRLARQQEAQDRLWRVLHPLLAPGARCALPRGMEPMPVASAVVQLSPNA